MWITEYKPAYQCPDCRPRVHKETENEDQAQDQIDKFPP